jgi:hypothetical protein
MPHLRLSLLGFALMVSPLSAPALAVEEPPQEVTMANPWMASGLSLAAPALLGIATFPAFAVGAPLGVGAGHLYSGAHERALYVTLGGAGAFAAGWLWGYYGPNPDLRPRRLPAAVFSASVTTLAFSLWAAWDAAQVANKNIEQAHQ